MSGVWRSQMLYANSSGTIIGMQYLQRRATQPLTRLQSQSYTQLGLYPPLAHPCPDQGAIGES